MATGAEARRDRLAVAGVGLALAGAGALGVVAWVGGEGHDHAYAVALAVVFAIPGAAAAVGLHRRPMVVIAAGVLLLPLSAISLAAWPLIVPAFLLLVGGIRRDQACIAGRVPPRELVAGAFLVGFGLLALGSLLSAPRQEAAHYGTTYATTSTGTVVRGTGTTEVDDEVASRDALLPVALAAAAIMAPLLVAPRARQRSSASV
jgi:hypothetical protein